MRETSSSLPDSYSGLSGLFFIDTSSSGRAGCYLMTAGIFSSVGKGYKVFFLIFFLTPIYYCTKYITSSMQPRGYGLKQGQELSKCATTKEIHEKVRAVLSCLWCDYVSLDGFPQSDFVECECLDKLG